MTDIYWNQRQETVQSKMKTSVSWGKTLSNLYKYNWDPGKVVRQGDIWRNNSQIFPEINVKYKFIDPRNSTLPNIRNVNKITIRHILIKLLKITDKEKNM